MPIKVAINGYGHIGRNILRAIYESGRTSEFQVVAHSVQLAMTPASNQNSTPEH